MGDYIKDGVLKNPYTSGPPTKEKVKKVKAWLRKYCDKYSFDRVRFYHGTDKNIPVLEEGLKPTSKARRRSLQSESGYVYLAATYEDARMFGNMGSGTNDCAVYCVDILPCDMKADIDQLSNMRSVGWDVGNTVAESIVYGGGVRVKGSIPPYAISLCKKPNPPPKKVLVRMKLKVRK